jgi:hypothetical protein
MLFLSMICSTRGRIAAIFPALRNLLERLIATTSRAIEPIPPAVRAIADAGFVAV